MSSLLARDVGRKDETLMCVVIVLVVLALDVLSDGVIAVDMKNERSLSRSTCVATVSSDVCAV